MSKMNADPGPVVFDVDGFNRVEAYPDGLVISTGGWEQINIDYEQIDNLIAALMQAKEQHEKGCV